MRAAPQARDGPTVRVLPEPPAAAPNLVLAVAHPTGGEFFGLGLAELAGLGGVHGDAR